MTQAPYHCLHNPGVSQAPKECMAGEYRKAVVAGTKEWKVHRECLVAGYHERRALVDDIAGVDEILYHQGRSQDRSVVGACMVAVAVAIVL